MRKRMATLTLGLLLGLSTLTARPAAALSCLHPADQLPNMQLIVQGRVEKVSPRFRLPSIGGMQTIGGERPEDITLAVSRYYKGSGPAQLEAVYDGMGWGQMSPVGSEVIMEFHLDEKGAWRSGACSLRINATPQNEFDNELLTLIKAQFGEGHPPSGETAAPVPEGNRGVWVLWTALGLLGALTAYLRFRPKRSA